MSRKVVIASAKSNQAIKIEGFTGTTFADLKAMCAFSSIYGGGEGVEVVVKPGNTTLRGDDSVLPTGDFNVFIIPTKNKAGITPAEVKDIVRGIEAEILSKSQRANATEKAALRINLAAAVAQVYAVSQGQAVEAVASTAPVDTELAAALAEASRM